ncbi:MAG: acyl carrier protein [Sphaerochaetaceae bacterium]|nr:acyl carrier protein [Sphaerochaetaceae bacterium]
MEIGVPDMENISCRLLKIVSEYTEAEPDKIDMNGSIRLTLGLDSFGLLSLLNAVESEFSITIPDEDLANFQTLNDVVLYLDNKVS